MNPRTVYSQSWRKRNPQAYQRENAAKRSLANVRAKEAKKIHRLGVFAMPRGYVGYQDFRSDNGGMFV